MPELEHIPADDNGYGRLPAGRAAELAGVWSDAVRRERDQVESLPERPNPEDFYRPVAESFRGGTALPDEEILDALFQLTDPNSTWLDLGAGGGRFAIPLASKVKNIVAVEPSAGMREVLSDAIARAGVKNIQIYNERWPGPSAAPEADVGFIANVGHDIEEIGPFLAELEAHAGSFCLALLNEQSPLAFFATLWRAVHGEERILLPGARQLAELLLARGILPQIRTFKLPARIYPDVQTLHEQARRPLWVLEGSTGDRRLRDAVERIAVPVDGGVTLPNQNRHMALITWGPAAA